LARYVARPMATALYQSAISGNAADVTSSPESSRSCPEVPSGTDQNPDIAGRRLHLWNIPGALRSLDEHAAVATPTARPHEMIPAPPGDDLATQPRSFQGHRVQPRCGRGATAPDASALRLGAPHGSAGLPAAAHGTNDQPMKWDRLSPSVLRIRADERSRSPDSALAWPARTCERRTLSGRPSC
jgi:hypothetical protein